MSYSELWYPVSPNLKRVGRTDRDLNGDPITTPPGSSRDDLVPLYGTYVPQPNQVGCSVPLDQLTDYNSPSTVDVQVSSVLTLENKKVYGRIKINAGGQVIAKNCVFLGPPGEPPGRQGPTRNEYDETAIIDCDNPGGSSALVSTFTDCTIAPRFPSPRLNGFKGSHHKVERCHIIWTVDGLGPYTKPGFNYATKVELVASRIERMVYFPGPYYAATGPNYWNGTTWASGTSGRVARSTYPGDMTPAIDYGHDDGNHSDCIEVHGGYGSHTFNQTTQKWTGDGIHIWGNALICDDAYGQWNDPTGLGLPVPGRPGSVSGSSLGYGDNTNRGLPGGGQRPNMTRPITSGWTKAMKNGQYAALGSGIIVAQIVNQFPSPTTCIINNNYFDGGGVGMQEQKKNFPTISFHFYDNKFGPDWYEWRDNRDIYVVRINDKPVTNPDTGVTTTYVTIPNHPVTGAPPFESGGSNKWLDPQNIWGYNGQPLATGSGSVNKGVRYG